MGSADFRIIPHKVAESADGSKPDLYRYLVAYLTSYQPQFIAASNDGSYVLVHDEKEALRFASVEDAEAALNKAREFVACE